MRAALTTAMKAKDAVSIKALRSTLGALDNAEAVVLDPTPVPTTSATIAGAAMGLGAADAARHELTIDDAERVVRAEIAERHDAAEQYDTAGQGERAATLRAEAAVLEALLGR